MIVMNTCEEDNRHPEGDNPDEYGRAKSFQRAMIMTNTCEEDNRHPEGDNPDE